MTAMRLTRQDILPQQRSSTTISRRRERFTTQFGSLDPAIVNATIPAFFIGRNLEGFWVARDANGRIGGIFLLEMSALSFARRQSRPNVCATVLLSKRFELDLENSGNPLAGHLQSLMRLTRRQRRRAAALIGMMANALKRRLDRLHAF